MFIWDEPEGCTTPRGWCSLTKDSHPDQGAVGWEYGLESGLTCCGSYLTYQQASGPNGERVHGTAYIGRLNSAGVMGETRLGYMWFNTVEEAKAFIEGNLRAYFAWLKGAKFDRVPLLLPHP